MERFASDLSCLTGFWLPLHEKDEKVLVNVIYWHNHYKMECLWNIFHINIPIEVVYVTIANPAFCLALYLTGVHFQGELQQVGHVGGQRIKCRPIRTREMGGDRLQEELYVSVYLSCVSQKQRLQKILRLICSEIWSFRKQMKIKICQKYPYIFFLLLYSSIEFFQYFPFPFLNNFLLRNQQYLCKPYFHY